MSKHFNLDVQWDRSVCYDQFGHRSHMYDLFSVVVLTQWSGDGLA